MTAPKSIPAFLFAGLFLAGCQTTEQPNDEFVGSVVFSELATYEVGPPVMVGFGPGAPDRMAVEEVTRQVLAGELTARGFEVADGDADFVVRPKWTRRAGMGSDQVDSFGSINTGGEEFYDSYMLAIEAMLPGGDVFWRGQTPRSRQIRVISGETAGDAVRYVFRNFPERVDQDPELESIE